LALTLLNRFYSQTQEHGCHVLDSLWLDNTDTPPPKGKNKIKRTPYGTVDAPLFRTALQLAHVHEWYVAFVVHLKECRDEFASMAWIV
jgi:hypothetical protein